jgi:hypothetical protein
MSGADGVLIGLDGFCSFKAGTNPLRRDSTALRAAHAMREGKLTRKNHARGKK